MRIEQSFLVPPMTKPDRLVRQILQKGNCPANEAVLSGLLNGRRINLESYWCWDRQVIGRASERNRADYLLVHGWTYATLHAVGAALSRAAGVAHRRVNLSEFFLLMINEYFSSSFHK